MSRSLSLDYKSCIMCVFVQWIKNRNVSCMRTTHIIPTTTRDLRCESIKLKAQNAKRVSLAAIDATEACVAGCCGCGDQSVEIRPDQRARPLVTALALFCQRCSLSQFVIMQPQLTAAARTCHSTLAILFLSSTAFHPKWYINYFYGVFQSGTPVFDCVSAVEMYK